MRSLFLVTLIMRKWFSNRPSCEKVRANLFHGRDLGGYRSPAFLLSTRTPGHRRYLSIRGPYAIIASGLLGPS